MKTKQISSRTEDNMDDKHAYFVNWQLEFHNSKLIINI